MEDNPTPEAERPPVAAPSPAGSIEVRYTGFADTIIGKAGTRVVTFERSQGHTQTVTAAEYADLMNQPEFAPYLVKLT